MNPSLRTAATGMAAQQSRTELIAHNLMNVNTTGFERSRAHFEDLLYPTIQGAPGDVRMPAGTPVQEIASALHSLRTPPAEIAASFESLRAVGAAEEVFSGLLDQPLAAELPNGWGGGSSSLADTLFRQLSTRVANTGVR